MKTLTITLILLALLSGCSQRICHLEVVDPNGVVTEYYLYKSNSVATDTKADHVKIVTRTGFTVEFNKFKQDNDSLKVVTPYGVVESTK